MKYTFDYRNPEYIQKQIVELAKILTHPWSIMEICGGQTHAILKSGLDQLLPTQIELIHGPGCPVCVTAIETIDKAIAIASLPNVIFTSYGDMLRVPGSQYDLFSVRGSGGDIRIVYSPLDALKIAQENPEKDIVFFAIGFETTAPANAMSLLHARDLKLANFSLLTAQVCVPPAMRAILSSPGNRVQAFLAAGHVCAVMGYWEYSQIAYEYKIPIVVTGFESGDILRGITFAVKQLEEKRTQVENVYERVVTYAGNVVAQNILNQVFTVCDRNWRGIGIIPASGWRLKDEWAQYDAEKRFSFAEITSQESLICIAGDVLQGKVKPNHCPAFGNLCTPDNPLGAPMVSAEGACAAYYQYKAF